MQISNTFTSHHESVSQTWSFKKGKSWGFVIVLCIHTVSHTELWENLLELRDLILKIHYLVIPLINEITYNDRMLVKINALSKRVWISSHFSLADLSGPELLAQQRMKSIRARVTLKLCSYRGNSRINIDWSNLYTGRHHMSHTMRVSSCTRR